MELHGENPFKIKSYTNAVFNLEKLDQRLEDLTPSELESVDGLGKSLSKVILELHERETHSLLEELVSKTPSGIIEMMDIKGIGPKKIKTIWEELGIESTYELKEACQSGQIAALKGFGDKTQKLILDALEFTFSNQGKWQYADAEPLAEKLENWLKDKVGQEVSFVGEYRRRMEIIETLEMLIATEDFFETIELLDQCDLLEKNDQESSPFKWRGKIKESDLEVCLHLCEPTEFISNLLLKTAAPLHLATEIEGGKTLLQVFKGQHFESEENAYQSVGFSYVEPELREGLFEIPLAKQNKLPKLVTDQDLKGILHNHSTYSDGKHTLEEMATYCKELGYEYLGITDHSKSAFYANGLKEDRILKQHQEINQLNEKLAPFKIFKGIESDILNDGSLDYSDEILGSFDFIVASIHSNLNMDVQKATNRLIKAIENPYTTILGHPTGRLLLRRAGYPIDHRQIIDACAANGVVIEINANPWRLDLDWRWIYYALEQGVMISINPDAHEKDGYHDMKYGTLIGRKGGLSAAMTFNALSLEEITAYFEKRKAKIK